MRRALKKTAAVLMSLLLTVSGSGCREVTGLDAQTLMSPPKTTEDRQAIFSLMRGDSADVTLVYPKNGENRSAVISRDLNGDGLTEVVSFCVSKETGGIRLEFFSKDAEGKWYSLARFASAANQVDRVMFGDLTGDGAKEIIVGWGDPQTATSSVSVYRLGGDAVAEFSMSTVTYGEMLLTDFDDNSVQELFVLESPAQLSEEKTALIGSLYRFDGEQPYISQTVQLDPAVTRYAAVSFSPINSWRSTVVLDGVKADGRMTTQIIGYDEVTQMLSSPLLSEAENPTDRGAEVAVSSRDVNDDDILDIPTAELVLSPGEGAPDSTNYVVTWNNFSFGDSLFTPVCRSILNTAENYVVPLPDDGRKYGCMNDPVTRTATFFTYSKMSYSGAPVDRRDVFAVTVYTEEQWNERDTARRELLLSSTAGRVYVLSILDDALSPDSEPIKTVRERFQILSE